MCARHERTLQGESARSAGGGAKHIAQRQGLNREVPTEGSPRQTIDLTNRNGLRHMLSGKTA